jgi:transcriptional regulator with XRE-family HTH domain
MSHANRFEQRRIELGLTQIALADQCTDKGAMVSDSQISKIERGLSVPLPPLRKALREILGTDPVTLAALPPLQPADTAPAER